MADRTIKTILRAETAAYERSMAAAAKATEAVGEAGAKASTKGNEGFRGLAESARENRAEWSELGQTLTGVGAIMAGLGGSVLAVGINYNVLQQQSRAALTSLMGSAEAANKQMDRLDDFARNSPFAKDAFIRAQQQMLGFGIEAQKVIPYLDAIQNAVAAAGGSNHDIAELSRIMAQISASAKITATDLREFGNRGIDAATLIGSQMGMTGAEIRDAITAGTLDAGEALDALAAGMSERFDGAAAGVKDTMVGAFDRVRAAVRDLASEMATPLVDPNGGGFLVDAANGAADFLRALQALPGPVKTAGAALFGVVAAATLAGGAFLMLTPRIQSAVASAKVLGPQLLKASKSMLTLNNAVLGMAGVGLALGGAALAASDFGEKFEYANTVSGAMMGMLAGPWGAAIGAATGFVMDYARGQEKAARDTSGLTASLDEQTGALTANSAAWIATELGSARAEFEALGISANEVTAAIMEGGPAVDALVARLDGFKTGDLMGDAGLGLLQTTVKGLASDVESATDELEEIKAAATEAGAGVSAGMQMGMDSVAAFTQSVRDSVDAMKAQRDEALRASNASLNYSQALLTSRAGVKEFAGALRGTALDQIDLTEEQIKARKVINDQAAAWNGLSDEAKNAPGAFKSARQALIQTATDMGYTEGQAKNLARQILEIPEKRATKVSLEGQQAVIGSAIAIGTALDKAARDRTVHIGVSGPGVGAGALGRADGGTIPHLNSGGTVRGQRTPYGDKVLAHLAPGEEVISNRHGQADRHRDLLKAINANSFAGGGTVGPSAGSNFRGFSAGDAARAQREVMNAALAAAGAVSLFGGGLLELRAALKESQKELKRERQRRAELIGMRDALADAIRSNYRSSLAGESPNPFVAGATSPTDILQADIAQVRALNQARKQLSNKGVKGGALDALLQEVGIEGLTAMSGWSKKDLREYQQLYDQRESMLTSSGRAAGQAAYGDAIRAQTKEVRSLKAEVKGLRRDTRQAAKQASKDAAAGRNAQRRGARQGKNNRKRG